MSLSPLIPLYCHFRSHTAPSGTSLVSISLASRSESLYRILAPSKSFLVVICSLTPSEIVSKGQISSLVRRRVLTLVRLTSLASPKKNYSVSHLQGDLISTTPTLLATLGDLQVSCQVQAHQHANERTTCTQLQNMPVTFRECETGMQMMRYDRII